MKQETLNLQNAVNDGENFTNQVTIPEVKTSPDAPASDTSVPVSDSAAAETEEVKTTKGKGKFRKHNFTNTSQYTFNPNYSNLQINIDAFLDNKMTLKDRGTLITIIAACAKNKSIYFACIPEMYGLELSGGSFGRHLDALIAKGYLMRKKAINVLAPEEYKRKNCISSSKVYYIRSDKPEYIPRESDNA